MIVNQSKYRVAKSIITNLLLLAFLFQVYNRVIYTHTHILPNGLIINHAHPYNKTNYPGPVTSHSHTREQILMFSLVELLFIFIATIQCLSAKEYILIKSKSISVPAQTNYYHLKNKSPPFL